MTETVTAEVQEVPQLPAPQQQSVGQQLAKMVAPTNQMTASVQIEAQRAAIQVASQVMAAQAMPRDEQMIRLEMLERCKDVYAAEVWFYAKPQGKNKETGEDEVVRGASIHLAKELAAKWQHIQFDVIDLGFYEKQTSRGNERFSEVEVQSWDVQRNTRNVKRFTVAHWQPVKLHKNGGYVVTDPGRAREIVGSATSKELRNAILNLIPRSLIVELKSACDATLARNAANPETKSKMVKAFADNYGVTQQQLEAFANKPLAKFEPHDIVNLKRVYSALKNGESVEDFFAGGGVQVSKPAEKPAAKPAPAAAKPAAKIAKPQGKPAPKEDEQAKAAAEAEAQAAEDEARAAAEAEAAGRAEAQAQAEAAAAEAEAQAQAEAESGDLWPA